MEPLACSPLERPRLSLADLAMFRAPRTWHEVLTSRPFREEWWWREAVIEADEAGRGLLRWSRSTGRWGLSAAGLELVEKGVPHHGEHQGL